MTGFLKILRAHLAVEIITLFRYPMELLSMYCVVTMILGGIFLGIRAFVPAGEVLGTTKAAIFVGYFFWALYIMTVQSAAWEVTVAANQGYLEREFVTPAGHGGTVAAKIIANTASGFIHYCLIGAVCILIFKIKLAWNFAAAALVIACSYLFFIGVGLVFAGLALVFKRVGSVISVIQIVFMALSFGALGNFGRGVEGVLRWFPYTHAIRLLRATMVMGEGVEFVFRGENLTPLLVGGVGFIVVGATFFRIMDRFAMDRGLIGQF